MKVQQYQIPVAACQTEQLVKKSRFIAHIAHTPSIAAAKHFIQQIKTQYSDARHNCWAFVADAPENSMQYGCSDDGEPSGTAGKPMLAQLTGSGVGEVTAVVTRYFGGIKLGTGGLVKAYGGSVQKALAVLTTETKVLCVNCQFSVPFELQNLFELAVNKFTAQINSRQYQQQLIANVNCPKHLEKELCVYLLNMSKGQIVTLREPAN